MSVATPEKIEPLPPPPKDIGGVSQLADKNCKIEVSNKQGYLCHIHCVADFDVPPEMLFDIFTYPDNSAVFRDIEGVNSRKVLEERPGYKLVEVEQIGKLKVLWMSRTYSTWLKVTEENHNPEQLLITFDLLSSDVLGRFFGKWILEPIRDPVTQQVIGCRCCLEQDVLPKGMPAFFKHIPVLGGVLRSVSLKAIQRIIEDVSAVLSKVKKSGKPVLEVMAELCGPTKFAGEQLKAHQFNVDEEEEEEEQDEEKQEEEKEQEGGEKWEDAEGGEGESGQQTAILKTAAGGDVDDDKVTLALKVDSSGDHLVSAAITATAAAATHATPSTPTTDAVPTPITTGTTPADVIATPATTVPTDSAAGPATDAAATADTTVTDADAPPITADTTDTTTANTLAPTAPPTADASADASAADVAVADATGGDPAVADAPPKSALTAGPADTAVAH